MHRLPSDELFHFYLGDPVEMLQLKPDGSGEMITLGTDIANDMWPQVVVASGTWQGCKLRQNGTYALLGTTMAPGFNFEDYEAGKRAELTARYPRFSPAITALTRV